jgi:hypothetical protein
MPTVEEVVEGGRKSQSPACEEDEGEKERGKRSLLSRLTLFFFFFVTVFTSP